MSLPESFASAAIDRRRENGFTVIELMIVVTIVSILAVIAMPAYLEYATRSKVGEGLVFVSEAKTSVSESFYSNSRWPADNFQAGLTGADTYDVYDWVKRLEIVSVPTSGTIEVTFKLPNTPAHLKKLWLVPSTASGEIFWTCKPADSDGMETRFLPPNCRI
jgi:type IV pilus assembly protein PilA